MDLLKIVQNIGDEIIKNRDYLTELDREIGDGDHGVNLARGFQKVKEELPNMEDMQLFELLNKVAMLLVSNVGGASGALYGAALLKGAAYAKTVDAPAETPEVIAAIWKEMIGGIQLRGKATQGEKTMLDTQIPAQEAFAATSIAGQDIYACFEAAERAAKAGMESTRDMIATKGRASYLKERSIGHLDPGAVSSYLMIKTVNDAVQKR